MSPAFNRENGIACSQWAMEVQHQGGGDTHQYGLVTDGPWMPLQQGEDRKLQIIMLCTYT